ncbi:MAG: YicC/YloC family endoribonuclease, partial [Pseudomonadota bacterium]
MLHSMTGFARQIAETPLGTLTCELRAVNHRYLDVQVRLPDDLRAKETEFRQQIGAALKRGKVECHLHFRRADADAGKLVIDEALAREVAARVADIAALLPDSEDPDPMDILRWPGVVVDPQIDTDPLYEEAHSVVGSALTAMTEMRRNEGQRIAEMLISRCEEIRRIGSAVRKRLPDVLAAVRQKQKDRLDKLDVT